MRMTRMTVLMLAFSAFASAAMADDAPATTGELARQIQSYQDASDCNGMIGLFYTEGVDSARKQSFSRTVQNYLCANFKHKIVSIAFQKIDPAKLKTPADFEDTHSAYTLPPMGVIVIDYGYGAPTETKSISFLYGMHDNKAWLITTRKADHQ